MLMLKQRFLRSITNLLSASPQVLDIDDDYQGALIRVLTKGIPLFVSHSPVVLQAIKPVKEILADGAAVKSLETSFLKDVWEGFSRLVLERAIFNAIYERDCAQSARNYRGCYSVGCSFQLSRVLSKVLTVE